VNQKLFLLLLILNSALVEIRCFLASMHVEISADFSFLKKVILVKDLARMSP